MRAILACLSLLAVAGSDGIERERAVAATMERLEGTLRGRTDFITKREKGIGPGRWAVWFVYRVRDVPEESAKAPAATADVPAGDRNPEEFRNRIKVSLYAHDTEEAARAHLVKTNQGISVAYMGKKDGPIGGECHEFQGMGVLVNCSISRFTVLVNASDFERGWAAVDLVGDLIASDSDGKR